MYNITLKNESNISNFPIEFVKQYIRVDGDDDDKIITLSLQFAELYAQRATGLIISPKVYVITTDEISMGSIAIKLHPVAKILSVKCGDTILNSNEYELVKNKLELYRLQNDAYVIEIGCGYGSLEEITSDLQVAILSHTAFHYNNRLNQNGAIAPNEVQAIYRSLRPIKII